MGLYIPDLRLPADGDFELWIAVRKDGSFTYNVSGGWRDGNQKAVPVPPHGDLIDRDALIKDGWLNLHKEVIRMGGYAIHELPLKNPSIPVIIPAEEGET